MKNMFKAMKLKPETAQEINDCATPDGMRRRLREYSFRGGESMVKAIFASADYRGMSGEDKMTWLAFEALQVLERFKELVMERAMLDADSPIILNRLDR